MKKAAKVHSLKVMAIGLAMPAIAHAQSLAPPPYAGAQAGVRSAGALQCHGRPNYVAMDSNGLVFVSIPNVVAIHAVCSVQSQGSYATGTEACKGIYASLQTATTTGSTIQLFYNGPTSCDQIPGWSQQRGFYYMSTTN